MREMLSQKNTISARMSAWRELIWAYSTMDLTYQSDKLSAIEGLASRMAQSLELTYLAGLWKEHLPDSLAWYWYSDLGTKSSRLEDYFPSWSWAAISGKVYTKIVRTKSQTALLTNYEAEILHIDCEYGAGGGSHGPLKHGNIKIKARKAHVDFDVQLHDLTNITYDEEKSGQVLPDVSDFSEFQDADDISLCILWDRKAPADRDAHHYALILRPGIPRPGSLPDNTPCYRRIGCYQYQDWSAEFMDRFHEEEIWLV